MDNNKICIIQHSVDGFGHQLHGLFSGMILHNIKNYYFDSHAYCNKHFVFEHISEEESIIMKQYLIESLSQFKYYYKQKPIQYKTIYHAHELHNIPNEHTRNVLYSIDNAYYFDRLHLSSNDQVIHNENIQKCKHFFMNKYIVNRLDKDNIVIHVRLGDAIKTERGDSINQYNNKLRILMQKLTKKYPTHRIYLHSDGNPDFLKDYNYTFFGGSTPLIHVLGDLIYSKILICGNSSLSYVSAFLGNHELIVINDDNTTSLPPNTKKISDCISDLSQETYNQINIALAFWGASSCLKYTIDSIHDKIIQVLQSNNIKYHIFMHTYGNNDYKLINPHFTEIESEDDIRKQLLLTNTNTDREIDTFTWKLYSTKKVCQLIINSGIHYDYILILPSDVSYITDFSLSFLNKVSNDTICVSDIQYCQDRVFLMNYTNLSLFGNLFYAASSYNTNDPSQFESSFYSHHLVEMCKLTLEYIPFQFVYTF